MSELFLFHLGWHMHSPIGELPFSIKVVRVRYNSLAPLALWEVLDLAYINSMKNDLQKRISRQLHLKKKKRKNTENRFQMINTVFYLCTQLYMSHCFGAVLCLSSNFLCFLHVLGAVKMQSLQFVLDDTFLIPELLFCFYSIQSCLLAFCPLGKVYCCMDHRVWRAFYHIFVFVTASCFVPQINHWC